MTDEEKDRRIAELERRLQRMTDLVRYQRMELHETGLITDEEYAALVQVEGAVARLEGYDGVRKALAEERARLKNTVTALVDLRRMVALFGDFTYGAVREAAQDMIVSIDAALDAAREKP